MTGLESRPAITSLRKPVKSSISPVRSRTGRASVSSPRSTSQARIQSPITPRASRPRGASVAALARRRPALRLLGVGRALEGGRHRAPARSGTSSGSPRRRRPAGSRRRRRCRPPGPVVDHPHRVVGGQRGLGGLAHDGVGRHHRAVHRVVGPRLAHHPPQREHVRARDLGDEVAHVVVGRRAHHLVGRADLHDLAVAHDQDPVAELERLGEVVGDEHHRLAELAVEPDHLVLHVAADQRVERRERLVEQQDVGVAGERPRQADPLLHAAGELVGVGVLVARQAHQVDDVAGRRAPLLLRACRGSRGRRPRCRSPAGAAAARSAGTPSRPACGAARAARSRRRR